MENQELFKKISLGDYKSFDLLYNKNIDSLIKYASKIILDKEVCKDIAQEVFVSLWTKRKELDIININAWLYGSVRKRALHELRNLTYRDKLIESFKNFNSQNQSSFDLLMDSNELNKLIEEEVELLPSKMKEIYVLSRNQYLSHKDIALKLNISDKTVKKQINNALKILRKKLSPYMGQIIFL